MCLRTHYAISRSVSRAVNRYAPSGVTVHLFSAEISLEPLRVGGKILEEMFDSYLGITFRNDIRGDELTDSNSCLVCSCAPAEKLQSRCHRG